MRLFIVGNVLFILDIGNGYVLKLYYNISTEWLILNLFRNRYKAKMKPCEIFINRYFLLIYVVMGILRDENIFKIKFMTSVKILINQFNASECFC